MSRVYSPVPGFSEDFSGWANYAAFTAARTDTDPLFLYYYGSEVQDDYHGFDFTRQFDGNPSMYLVCAAATTETNWGWFAQLPIDKRSMYVRARVELADTFLPATSGLPYAGFDLHVIYPDYLLGGYDLIRLTIYDGRLWILWTYDGDYEAYIDLGPATPWYEPVQYVVAAEVISNVYVKVQVYTGAMDAELQDLTLFGEATLHFPGIGVKLQGMEHYTGFWGDMVGSPGLEFKMWLYSIEMGVSPEGEGASLQFGELVRPRTSKEVPRLAPTFFTDFSEFANIAAFNSDRPWMFTTCDASGVFDLTRPYASGQNALKYVLRTSPAGGATHTSDAFTGPLAGTTNWAVRQVFELLPTFTPTMTLGGIQEGVRFSSIPFTDGLGAFDRSVITLNDGVVRHVWDSDNATHESTMDIDALGDWASGPVQVVHWVERITSTTVRVRIWFGAPGASYATLGLIHDAVYTSSFTDATVAATTCWSSHDGTEYPASNEWSLWIYLSQQGEVDYYSDPFVQLQETVTQAITTADAALGRKVAQLALEDSTVIASTLAQYVFAIATLQERMQVAETVTNRMSYRVAMLQQTFLREYARPGVGVAVTDAVQALDAATYVLAVSVMHTLRILPVLGAQGRYGRGVEEGVRLSAALQQFFGAMVADAIVLADAGVVTGRARGTLTDTLAIDAAVAPQWVLRAVVDDAFSLEQELSVAALWQAIVEEAVSLSAGLLLPNGGLVTWAVNTRTGAATNYSDYEYTSFAQRGTHYLATREDGLYRLDGDTDSGQAIIAQLTSGYLQFAGTQLSGFKAVYLGMHASGDVFLRLLTGDAKQYTYRVVAQNMQSTKVRVGKGLRARYFAFELETVGQDFDLDTVEFLPMPGQRRV